MDHETNSLRDEPGASKLTVMPRLLTLIGLSALRPLTGLRKHHAGTTPSSTLFSGSGVLLNKDFAVWTNDAFSRPTTHQPSSKDCTTVRCSPNRVRSSSGSTGSKSCRTLRAVPEVDFGSNDDDEPDITENRFWLLVKLMKELRDLEERSGSRAEFRGDAAPRANVNGLGANGVGRVPASRSSAALVSRARGMPAFSGRTMVELTMFLENPILWVAERLKSG